MSRWGGGAAFACPRGSGSSHRVSCLEKPLLLVHICVLRGCCKGCLHLWRISIGWSAWLGSKPSSAKTHTHTHSHTRSAQCTSLFGGSNGRNKEPSALANELLDAICSPSMMTHDCSQGHFGKNMAATCQQPLTNMATVLMKWGTESKEMQKVKTAEQKTGSPHPTTCVVYLLVTTCKIG